MRMNDINAFVKDLDGVLDHLEDDDERYTIEDVHHAIISIRTAWRTVTEEEDGMLVAAHEGPRS